MVSGNNPTRNELFLKGFLLKALIYFIHFTYFICNIKIKTPEVSKIYNRQVLPVVLMGLQYSNFFIIISAHYPGKGVLLLNFPALIF